MLINSPYPPVQIPSVDLWDFIFERTNLDFSSQKPIYIDSQTKEQRSWADVKNIALDFGTGLRQTWNWQKGDVLAVFSRNCIDYPSVLFGTIWTGGIVSPANPAYTVDELTFQLKSSGAKAIVTQPACLDIATKAAKAVGLSADRILLMDEQVSPPGGPKHISMFRGAYKPDQYQRPRLDPHKDVVVLCYSSGTTGLPKAVMLSHENMVANLLQLEAADEDNIKFVGGRDGNGDKILAVVPYYHVYGITCIVIRPAFRGLTTVVMGRYELKAFLQAVKDFRPACANLVPPIILQLTKSPLVADYDISSFKMVMCAAAPLTTELTEDLYQKYQLPIQQAYGLSETSPAALLQRWHNCRQYPGSVGYLVPNMVAKFCDEKGTQLPIGETGELYLKGPNIFQGYLNNQAATAACLDDDGWFRTGDIGHADREGNFYITDRVKELIKYKGFQVPPAELEGLLISHPQIVDAVVIGIYSDDHASELPRAYVVLDPSVEPTTQQAEAIVKWLEGRVAPHKRLRGGVGFIKEVPKNPSGKILRRVMRDKAKEEQKQSKPNL